MHWKFSFFQHENLGAGNWYFHPENWGDESKLTETFSGPGWFNHQLEMLMVYQDVSENGGFSPQIIQYNRVFHYFHHPFWGTTIFGNTHQVASLLVFTLAFPIILLHPRWKQKAMPSWHQQAASICCQVINSIFIDISGWCQDFIGNEASKNHDSTNFWASFQKWPIKHQPGFSLIARARWLFFHFKVFVCTRSCRPLRMYSNSGKKNHGIFRGLNRENKWKRQVFFTSHGSLGGLNSWLTVRHPKPSN